MAPQSKNGLDLSKPIGTKPGFHDVVIFRGGGTNHHPGSKAWRAMVDERKMDYIYAKTQKQKRAIVMECIHEHEASGGRYVGQYEGVYYVATEKKTYAKTIQRLRERSKEYQEKIEKMIPEEETKDLKASPASPTETILTQDDAEELCGLFPVNDTPLNCLFHMPAAFDDGLLHFYPVDFPVDFACDSAAVVVSDDDDMSTGTDFSEV
ncbi:expressed unknown protein [Seminavis robusta]|uniref:DUF6824 domain-containing protein n=1 Tax=Seminavis robusta TaxID=568900 RepID=A0A9N8EFP0_9STRA|nr:expressed unknown protein [Seminavis robusta]|eukprot:Sro875_g214380.1 n/a (208) ;mRNA; f:23098-23721